MMNYLMEEIILNIAITLIVNGVFIAGILLAIRHKEKKRKG